MSFIMAIPVALLLLFVFVWFGWCLPGFVLSLTQSLYKQNRYADVERIVQWALSFSTAIDALYLNGPLPRLYSPRLQMLDALSLCYFKQGKFDKSFQIDEERLRLLNDSGDCTGAAKTSEKIAIGYMLAGKLDEALLLSERAVPAMRAAYKNSLLENAPAIEKKQTDVYRAMLASCIFGRAWILEELHRFNEALGLRLEALSLTEEHYGRESFEVTPHLNRLGNLYREMGRLDEAEPLLLECLQIREKTRPESRLVASAQQALSDLYCAKGELEKAESYCRPAYKLALDELAKENKPGFAEFALSRAMLWAAQGKHLPACELLEKAITEAEPTYTRLNPRLLSHWTLLAECYEKTNQTEQASKAHARVMEICTRWKIPTKEPSSSASTTTAAG